MKPVNLNQFKKQKARAEKKARGDENAAKHGRSKSQKRAEAATAETRIRQLDGHKTED